MVIDEDNKKVLMIYVIILFKTRWQAVAEAQEQKPYLSFALHKLLHKFTSH